MDESADFIKSVQKVSQPKRGFPTRIEFDKKMPNAIRETISKKLGLPDYLTYEFDGPLGLVDLWQLLKIIAPTSKTKASSHASRL
jgi:polyphosphate kinase